MGLSGSKEEVWFYLASEGKKKPWKKVGPFRLYALAQMYKEEQITDETMVWSNIKFRMDPNESRKKDYMDGWVKIRDMPMEFHTRFQPMVASAQDRRQAGQPLAPLAPHTPVQGYENMQSPAMPAGYA
ncbi:hypothetical protein FVE85_6312 [Porphyridium purpureum]|uniref:GYF domain-containing protein n=1 Tax=Porphyridium purpureum TaxID=35688 RepID=A0A5J4Z7R7_PORPP|nr:hypothetical protein FVE85_6312 [Porphyridium purpureum]|eukprot:POR9485..scf295_1